MSQFYVGVTAGALPPAVPMQFTTDSGTAVPVANNLNVFGNDTTTNDADGLTTTGSGATVTVLLTNRLQGSGTTVGAATSDIITFTPSVVGVYSLEYRTGAFNVTSVLGAGYSFFGAIRFDGINSNICDAFDEIVNEEGAMSAVDLALVVSGADVILRATGYAAQTINWSSVGLYTFVGV